MSIFSPTVRFDPAGGALGGAGTALFNSLTAGNTLAHAMNQRAYENATINSQAQVTNANNANAATWADYRNALGHRAQDWFNNPGATQAPGQARTEQQPAGYSQSTTSFPTNAGEGAYGSRPGGPGSAFPYPSDAQALTDPRLQLALNSTEQRNAGYGEAARGIEAARGNNLTDLFSTPDFGALVQQGLQSGLSLPAAYGAAAAHTAISNPSNLGAYMNSGQLGRDYGNVQQSLDVNAGLGTSTGNFTPFNQAGGFAGPGYEPAGITGVQGGPGGFHYQTPYGGFDASGYQPFTAGTPQEQYARAQAIAAANASAAAADYARLPGLLGGFVRQQEAEQRANDMQTDRAARQRQNDARLRAEMEHWAAMDAARRAQIELQRQRLQQGAVGAGPLNIAAPPGGY